MQGGADPMMDNQVAASNGDAWETEQWGTVTTASTYILMSSSTLASARRTGGFRFSTGPFPAQGSTIDVAYLEVYIYSDSFDDARLDIYGQDVAAPDVFAATNYNI